MKKRNGALRMLVCCVLAAVIPSAAAVTAAGADFSSGLPEVMISAGAEEPQNGTDEPGEGYFADSADELSCFQDGISAETETNMTAEKDPAAPGSPEEDQEPMIPGSPEEDQDPAVPGPSEEDPLIRESFCCRFENGCAVIEDYMGTETVVQVPGTFEGYPVTVIGREAFRERGLTEVVLPEGIQIIESEAFSGNASLEKLNLPSTVTEIGENAFSGCDALVLYCCEESYGLQYARENNLRWELDRSSEKSVENCLISMKEKVVYTGRAVGADIVITDGDTVLERGKDYELVYSDNTEPGVAGAVITGTGEYTGSLEKTFQIIPAEPVMKSAVSAGYNSVKISWKAAKGAQTYNIFYKGNGIKTWKRIAAGVKGTSYTHVSSEAYPLETGKKYRYTVRAAANGQVSTFSTKGKVAKPVLGRANLKSVQSAAYNKLRITWDAVPGADGYLVFRLSDGSWQRVARTTNTFYDHTASAAFPISIGVSYTYTVRAFVKVGTNVVYGGFSTKGISGKTVPDQVQLVSAVNGKEYGKITITWKKAQGATAYVIYRKLSGASKWERLTAVNGADTVSYVHTDSEQFPMEPDSTYVYTVQSYSSAGKVYGTYDQKGVSVKTGASSGITDDQLREKAREVIARVTTPGMSKSEKLKKCWYQVLWSGFHAWEYPDKTKKGWKYKCAWDLLTTGAGNCYGYANGFAALARELGYTPYVIEIPMVHCFVRIDGKYWDNMGNKMGVSYSPMSYTASQISKF